MTTPYTAVSITQLFDAAGDCDDLDNDAQDVQNIVDNMPDPVAAFGNDDYGKKVIPNILAAKQQGDDLLTGVRGMMSGAGQNLKITGQSFTNADDTNQGLVKPVSVNP
jgi:hypothetical protein